MRIQAFEKAFQLQGLHPASYFQGAPNQIGYGFNHETQETRNNPAHTGLGKTFQLQGLHLTSLGSQGARNQIGYALGH